MTEEILINEINLLLKGFKDKDKLRYIYYFIKGLVEAEKNKGVRDARA